MKTAKNPVLRKEKSGFFSFFPSRHTLRRPAGSGKGPARPISEETDRAGYGMGNPMGISDGLDGPIMKFVPEETEKNGFSRKISVFLHFVSIAIPFSRALGFRKYVQDGKRTNGLKNQTIEKR